MRVLFPVFLPTFVVCVLDVNYSDSSEVESSHGLICISFMARDGEHFFHVF
jgi:hypothetical protein